MAGIISITKQETFRLIKDLLKKLDWPRDKTACSEKHSSKQNAIRLVFSIVCESEQKEASGAPVPRRKKNSRGLRNKDLIVGRKNEFLNPYPKMGEPYDITMIYHVSQRKHTKKDVD